MFGYNQVFQLKNGIDFELGRDQRLARFEETLAKALKDKGRVLIPAFALGLTQEILYEIDRLLGLRCLDKIPVVIDSPLGVKLTGVYESQNQFWDKEARNLLTQGTTQLISMDSTLRFNPEITNSYCEHPAR